MTFTKYFLQVQKNEKNLNWWYDYLIHILKEKFDVENKLVATKVERKGRDTFGTCD